MNSQKDNNPLLCDVTTGMCEMPIGTREANQEGILAEEKPIKILYYTDPICSSCWGVEPQLHKLKLEYGHLLTIDYRMGGLLPDWSYNSGGISSPKDVAGHWDEVSLHYDMPIDGDLWLEDPMSSSYPPSIAFKAAQLQAPKKAILFLRQMRELMFLSKKNMTKWENILLATKDSGLDTERLLSDYKGKAVALFNEDLQLAKKNGVRGFPTFIFSNKEGASEFIYGTRPYDVFESKVLELVPTAEKKAYDTSVDYLFEKFNSLTLREFSELSGLGRQKSKNLLERLSERKWLSKIQSKNGDLFFKSEN
ncbi:Predicted dithiol-disulfide isomerase, DsbA family [Arenibacter nanhaiticus]|uniref:Predicted dithiol-disulfide isomerase, DsbA family n=1 Tax=Arenibacter nanhaiticus TaxID=558155 RepID=A0A1M6CB78_9FLAO|nr:DsbA family protein [Arenibacter nanhaiticus]SHI58295.1 Predicted dithiol-disulfide isomerase, DsbA family [Arenibacter nanhaiticus]